jgi:hypothetical protein
LGRCQFVHHTGDYFRVENQVDVVRRQGVLVVAAGGDSYDFVGEAKEARENNQYRDPESRDSKARAKLGTRRLL